MKNYILFAAIAALFASCQFNTPKEQDSKPVEELQQGVASNLQQGIAKEVLQTNNYTYILLDMDGKETWIAGPRMEASSGVKYYFIQNMEMENFKSKELNRSFEKVIFAQGISNDPDSFNEQSQGKSDYQAEVKTTKQAIKIEITKGITNIADVYSNKDKYSGKTVTVKGIVTKYNAQIMDKNWIHLQDGTERDGHFDLVITTQVKAKPGDTLTLTGKLALDQDFGYGYKYDVLLEDAVKK